MQQYFSGLAADRQERILKTSLLVYECEGQESEIKEWFQTINIVGLPLNEQELLNAVYSGPFVTKGKAEFSNSQNSNINKWGSFIKGAVGRQAFWQAALDWVSKGDVSDYMSAHRHDTEITEVKAYFKSVIDWAATVFFNIEQEMRGLEWGRLYELYHSKGYDPAKVSAEVRKLYGDPYIKDRKGIFEYILGGSQDNRLLNIRLFDEAIKRIAYQKQTSEAKLNVVSNCPTCSLGTNVNKTKIWTLSEMDADHVTPWSKGGATDASNCEMLCRNHNMAKGNR
jgi:hypothetical protein